MEYKINTALSHREIKRRRRRWWRQGLSWDKFVTNLEHDTYRMKPKVYEILKQISKDIKETALIVFDEKKC